MDRRQVAPLKASHVLSEVVLQQSQTSRWPVHRAQSQLQPRCAFSLDPKAEHTTQKTTTNCLKLALAQRWLKKRSSMLIGTCTGPH